MRDENGFRNTICTAVSNDCNCLLTDYDGEMTVSETALVFLFFVLLSQVEVLTFLSVFKCR